MPVERIQPAGLIRPPTYRHVVKTGNTVYIAGQVAQDESGQVVGPGDITAQATQVFENLARALASVGADFSNLAKMTIYLTDPRYREPLGAVRSKYLGDNLPASTLVVVAGLASPDYLIEIEGIAYVG
jgi:enamine deaminase RidA (YjgF/YER057c/UK114 family)